MAFDDISATMTFFTWLKGRIWNANMLQRVQFSNVVELVMVPLSSQFLFAY
jgi:hypothetical protein